MILAGIPMPPLSVGFFADTSEREGGELGQAMKTKQYRISTGKKVVYDRYNKLLPQIACQFTGTPTARHSLPCLKHAL